MFGNDVRNAESELSRIVSSSRFLVLGGAGSIGMAVTKEIFQRNPQKLHVVDISENDLVELVRDIRSSYGYIDGDFKTYALDIGSLEYDAFIKWDGAYDYVLNLSALKHVRSEKDPYTLMRMIDVNVFNTEKTIKQSIEAGATKYFCVSTDKAANPVSMMGASKRIMEMFLMRYSKELPISTARFANVAFSNGSLLHSFNQRLTKNQPIVAPKDVKRYFVTFQEAGELCLMSCIFGDNRDIFFPKLDENVHLVSMAYVAEKFLESKGYKAYLCKTEDEARESVRRVKEKGMWPCLFGESDTSGEKGYEEFYTDKETLDMEGFEDIGIIKNEAKFDSEKLEWFRGQVMGMKQNMQWTKEAVRDVFFEMIPDFGHQETGKSLDQKM